MKHSKAFQLKKSSFGRTIMLIIVALILALTGYTQQCSRGALEAKYWQYRESFNKHFIATDRDPSGCVHDGIGQSPSDPCICSKSGLSLPATGIRIENNGTDAMDRWKDESIFYDRACFDNDGLIGTDDASWEAPYAKHNWLDMGQETPHQLGWYLVTLSTEYELLGQSGQTEAQQHTLEEIFLALQAYRRMDIEANCIARARY